MTADELVQELTGDRQPPSLDQVLALIDRIVSEAGRRRHMFGWLRVPGGAADEWLTVDSYYPANRLVVCWRSTPGAHDAVFRERMPAHELRLLELTPDDIGPDLRSTEPVIERKLAQLGPAPPRAVGRTVYEGPTAVERAMSSLAAHPPPPLPPRRVGASQAAAAERAARFVSARRPPGARRPPAPAARPATAPRRPLPPPRPRPVAPAMREDPSKEPETAAFWITLVLAAALVIEVYVGVGVVGIDGGHLVLAFGLALDVCARALGAVAARRAGQEQWALWCALGGSPFVANFALFQQDGPVEAEPAPLAGLIAVAACAVVALGIAVAALGG